MTFLPVRTDDDNAKITADYMVNGRHVVAKRRQDKKLYKLFKGYSKEFTRLEGYLNELMEGVNITKSTAFVEEWEQTAGIPDKYFLGSSVPLVERQKYVITKMSSEGVSSASEIEWLFSKMGLAVNVYPGHFFWTNPDPRVGSFTSEKQSRFTIVIELDPNLSDPAIGLDFFPVSFPWVFGYNSWNVMQGFIEEIVDSTVDLRFIIKSSDIIQDVTTGTDIIQDITTGTDIIQDNIF